MDIKATGIETNDRTNSGSKLAWKRMKKSIIRFINDLVVMYKDDVECVQTKGKTEIKEGKTRTGLNDSNQPQSCPG